MRCYNRRKAASETESKVKEEGKTTLKNQDVGFNLCYLFNADDLFKLQCKAFSSFVNKAFKTYRIIICWNS